MSRAALEIRALEALRATLQGLADSAQLVATRLEQRDRRRFGAVAMDIHLWCLSATGRLSLLIERLRAADY